MRNPIFEAELKRFNAINKYAGKLLNEQDVPVDPNAAPADPNAVPGVDATAGAVPGVDGAADPNAVPGVDPSATPPTEGAPTDETLPEPTDTDPSLDDSTEEIDITELVNMTKSIKKELEDSKGKDGGVTQKMDDVFSKLSELESMQGEMAKVLAKIDQLGAEIQQVKPKTPMEKLEMRSLDSYPFNKKPDQFFSEKQQEMKTSGKNEYVLTKGDVENYSKYDVMKSFNPEPTTQY
jgi:hypothetical protein